MVATPEIPLDPSGNLGKAGLVGAGLVGLLVGTVTNMSGIYTYNHIYICVLYVQCFWVAVAIVRCWSRILQVERHKCVYAFDYVL